MGSGPMAELGRTGKRENVSKPGTADNYGNLCYLLIRQRVTGCDTFLSVRSPLAPAMRTARDGAQA
jgi:hypothetical protein